MNTLSVYLFSFDVTAISNVRVELQGASVLSFAAVSNVRGFVPKLHGAPTKRHQVTTVVVCFFNYSRNAF